MRRARKYFFSCCAGIFISVIAVSVIASQRQMEMGSNCLVYFGTFNKGIYAYRFTPSSGKLEQIGQVADTERPTWLAIHPNHRILYAVSEVGNDGKSEGYITSYKIDPSTGGLTLLNKKMAGGGGTTYVIVDRTAKTLLAANFGGGQVAAFHLNPDGSIGPRTALIHHPGSDAPTFQTRPHPHGLTVSADNRYLFVPDTGLNKLFIYKFDAGEGTLTPGTPAFITMPTGYGPRRVAFAPNGKFAYLIEENESAVTVFAYTSATGELRLIQTVSTLPENFKGEKSASESWIDHSGRFLYAASRSDETIVVYAIDPRQGTLSVVQRISSQGKAERHLAADPTGRYLFVANQNSDNVGVFTIDANSGKLSPMGQGLSVPAPTSVLFVPAG